MLETSRGPFSLNPPSPTAKLTHYPLRRKGVQKANAKFEPALFRDQFVKHLESVPVGDYDAVASKLDVLGNQVRPLVPPANSQLIASLFRSSTTENMNRNYSKSSSVVDSSLREVV